MMQVQGFHYLVMLTVFQAEIVTLFIFNWYIIVKTTN